MGQSESCSACGSVLHGSWLVQLESDPGLIFPTAIRGPMRIDVAASQVSVRGDIYAVRRRGPLDRAPLPIPAAAAPVDPTSPGFPADQYSWAFRSTEMTCTGGELRFDLVRRLWDRSAAAYTSTDQGQMTLSCRGFRVVPSAASAVMTGTLTIGGASWQVSATKTSSSTAATVLR